MIEDTLKSILAFNGLVLTGSAAVSLTSYTPLPLDIALIVAAGSCYLTAAALSVFTIKQLRKKP